MPVMDTTSLIITGMCPSSRRMSSRITPCYSLLPARMLPSAIGAEQPCYFNIWPAGPSSSGATAHLGGLQVAQSRMPLPLWSGNAG